MDHSLESHISLPQLLLQPVKYWTSRQLQAANLVTTDDAEPTSILQPEDLPEDGEEGTLHYLRQIDFEERCHLFCQDMPPQDSDRHLDKNPYFVLVNFTFASVRLDPKLAIDLINPLMWATRERSRRGAGLFVFRVRSVPLKVASLNHKTRMKVHSVMAKNLTQPRDEHRVESVPLATFDMASEPIKRAVTEVSQGLLQIANAYNCNPNLDEYSGYIMIIDRLIVYFTRVVGTKDYVRCLYEKRPIPDELRLFRSAPVDLETVDGKRQFIRFALGLYRRAARSEVRDCPCGYRFIGL